MSIEQKIPEKPQSLAESPPDLSIIQDMDWFTTEFMVEHSGQFAFKLKIHMNEILSKVNTRLRNIPQFSAIHATKIAIFFDFAARICISLPKS